MTARSKGEIRQGLVPGVVVLSCQGVEGQGWPSSSPHGRASSVPDMAELQHPTAGSWLIPTLFLREQPQKTRHEGRVLFKRWRDITSQFSLQQLCRYRPGCVQF
ncbi:hypothetical protein SAMN04515658_101118 [Idiomarina zobellii]|nr:hypothetical protein SAMN04515658_101118 [Idiomarina zobellii]